jgi:dTDP-4-dehydrorhamnose 3,5-epimerase
MQPSEGFLPDTRKDPQSITSDWEFRRPLLDGVRVKEVRNVPKSNGALTEVYRSDWGLDALPVDQVFQVMLFPGAISAWHVHRFTTDRLFVNQGLIHIVLFDAREGSPTYGQLNEFRFGSLRPALVLLPPGVWHGIHNLAPEPSLILNLVDQAYRYEDPDHWRLPIKNPHIPYQFV